MRPPLAGLAIVAGLGAADCGIPEYGPQMLPGEDCQTCHRERGEASPSWVVSGTLFPRSDSAAQDGIEGAEIRLTDARGRRLTVRTNGAGNFYTAESLEFPLRVEVHHRDSIAVMPIPVPDGACNGCHRLPPREDAPGRIYVR